MLRIRYAKTIASCAAVAGLALLLTLVLTHTGPAKPRPAPLPGIADPLSTGTYLTAINIHNPSFRETITLYKRAVLAPPESDTTAYPPSAFHSYSLLPGYAVEIDCADIATLLNDTPPPIFPKGFVTILSREPLDVVGVYTAEPPQTTISSVSVIPGIGLKMLNIAPRIEFMPAGTLAPGQGPTGRVYEYSAKFLCLPPPS